MTMALLIGIGVVVGIAATLVYVVWSIDSTGDR